MKRSSIQASPKREYRLSRQKKNNSMWMTKGIKTSIYKKRELYLNSRNSSDPKLKKYYKLYCKQLNKVIKEAKFLHYKEQI